MARSLELAAAVRALLAHYGQPEPLPTADPFELVLWENVAYLASPPRRRAAFALLARTIGTTPPEILAAERSALERVTGHGILAHVFAAKLVECARIAFEEFDGDLSQAIRQPLDAAKRALRRFPGIGEPGAEKILLFTGRHALLAPDSNGLRVLVRLGFVREEKSYARTYAASRAVAGELGSRANTLQKAHLLLQQHGQTLCKRSAPRCRECPLLPGCAYARAVHVASTPRPRPTSRRSAAPRGRRSGGSR